MKHKPLFIVLLVIAVKYSGAILFFGLIILGNVRSGWTIEQRYERTVSFYNEKKDVIYSAVETGNFSELQKLKDVDVRDDGGAKGTLKDAVSINIGGYGIVPSGGCYGIYYSPHGYFFGVSFEELKQTEDGWYSYQIFNNSDNYYYFRLIEDNFYFYEETW
ncbi:MAG: hypothetical protein IJM71_02595 [Clostridia bacterium]|nr:hypothetical protein [Clostridia bacterium]